jgi:Zn-dependent peptidase ImmA (M78 family)
MQAAESAGRLLDELGIEITRQIDVFSICEELGLWLAFMPMDGLLGAFVPEGTGGVLITEKRPIPVQRYTAAHELGHWRLEHGHGLALDGEEHVFGTTQAERERLAQVFAASLLMPPALVLSLLGRVGLGGDKSIGPRDAYYVAREAGVSYEASVRQMGNLQVITPAEVTALLRVRPLTVKSDLAGGRRPVHGYADVWPVDEAWNNQQVSLKADDEVIVSLPENRSTGYRWLFEDEITEVRVSPEPPSLTAQRAELADPADTRLFLEMAQSARPGQVPGAALERVRRVPDQPPGGAERSLPGGIVIVGDDYIPGRAPMLPPREARRARLAATAGHPSAERPEGGNLAPGSSGPASSDAEVVIAATGRRLLGIRFADAGPKTLRLEHRSPYDPGSFAEDYVIHAIVEPSRHGFAISQLADDPQEEWVNEVRERQLREPAVFDNPEQG